MYSTRNDGPKVMCSSLVQDTRYEALKRDTRPLMQPMHQNSSEVDCCCLEIRGELAGLVTGTSLASYVVGSTGKCKNLPSLENLPLCLGPP